jgi:Immunity protein Imm5
MSELQDAIEAARRDLNARADGQLIRGRRHAVLRALGGGETGRVRRARLAGDTVRHVLPLWQAVRPGDQDPAKLLEELEPVLAGKLDPTDVQRAAGMLWAHTDNLIVTTGPEAPMHVGYAASKALQAALRDEPLDPPDTDPDQTDFGRDPRRLDTAFIAAGAVAGGAPWDDGSDPEQRRQFWTWWLDRAAQAGD